MASTVLKLSYNGEIHRVLLGDGEVTFHDVDAAIKKVWADRETIGAKYVDDEGDKCTLCEASFNDFLALCSEAATGGRRVLRLELERPLAPAAAPASVAPTLPAEQAKSQPSAPQFSPANILGDLQRSFNKLLQGHGPPEKMPDIWMSHLLKNNTWFMDKKKIVWVLARMRAAGVLNGKTVAALAVQFLPKIIAHTVEHMGEVDAKASNHGEKLHPFIEDLREVVRNTAGLEHCEVLLAAFLSGNCSSMGETILALLTSLDSLPREALVDFVERLFASQETKLNEILDKADKDTPEWLSFPLVHAGVACDGCNASPIQGPRFKCKDLPDYDLCGECFTKMGKSHVASGHEFECLIVDWSNFWSMGHRMQRCRRKGWCKGQFGSDSDSPTGQQGEGKGSKRCADGKSRGEMKACPGGCGFVATWHPTHCCRKCSVHPGYHGPACHRRPVPPQPEEESKEETPKAMRCDEQEKAPPPHFDFSFPVEVEDGRRLVISWNQGDEPLQVAASFVREHGIPIEEIPTIISFVEQAVKLSQAKAGAEEESRSATRPAAEEKNAMAAEDDAARAEAEQKSAKEEEMSEDSKLAELASMGFGGADDIVGLLRDCGGDMQKVIDMLTSD